MKAFVAYRNTGQDRAQLQNLLSDVVGALGVRGVTAYCTFFVEPNYQRQGAREIMDHAFSVIRNSDLLFVLQTSEVKSEGMLMEVGYCLHAEIPIIVATEVGVENTYLPEMASVAFKWADTEDLCQKIKEFQFP